MTTHRGLLYVDHYIYVFWKGDEPLYVGCTYNWMQRMSCHGDKWTKHGATHVDVWAVGLPRVEALELERATIKALQPSLNVIGSHEVHRRRPVPNPRLDALIARAIAETFPAIPSDVEDRIAALMALPDYAS